MAVEVWSITAIAVLVVCLRYQVHMAEYLRKSILDDYIPADGSLYKTTTRSKLECSAICESVTGVRSFFYVQTTQACECHDITYAASTGLSGVPSATYYEKQGFVCPPEDPSSFIQVVLSDGSQFEYRPFVDEARTFDEAVAKCLQEGATLLEVLTLEKFNFSMKVMKCPGYETRNAWISGVYNSTSSRWETLGGVPLPMSNTFWGTGEPNSGGVYAPCVWMWEYYGHKWDDRPCTLVHAGLPLSFTICERL